MILKFKNFFFLIFQSAKKFWDFVVFQKCVKCLRAKSTQFKNLLLLCNLMSKCFVVFLSSHTVRSMWGERKTELRWEFTWRALNLRWALSGCSSLRVLSDSSSRNTDGEKAVLLLRSINREPEAFNLLVLFLDRLRSPCAELSRFIGTLILDGRESRLLSDALLGVEHHF